MKALVVRKDSDGSLACFGPDNGMYVPGVPAGFTKTVEPDYDVVFLEWQALELAKPKVKTLEERVTALEAQQ